MGWRVKPRLLRVLSDLEVERPALPLMGCDPRLICTDLPAARTHYSSTPGWVTR